MAGQLQWLVGALCTEKLFGRRDAVLHCHCDQGR